MGIFDFAKKKQKSEEEFSFQLTKKQLIWVPVLEAYGRKWPILFCARRSASAYATEDIYRQATIETLENNREAIAKMIVRKYPKIALFGHFSEIVGSIALNGTEEVFETKKVKILIKPSDKTKGGYVFYNSHPIAEEVLEQNDPLRKQYPTLSRLLSVYYDEDFYDETSKEPQNPLSVMAEFCFEELAERVQNLLEEITNYLQTKPTPEEADAFLTSLGNEFYYQASEISAIEWLEYLSVRLDQWVFHGDEPISSKE